MSNGKYDGFSDPDDMFSDTRMSFGDHIEDLRTHLWKAIWGFVFCLAACLCIGNYLVEFIADPVEKQLERFNERSGRLKAERMRQQASKDKYYGNVKRFPIDLNRNELRKAVGLEPLPEPLLGKMMHGFEGQLDALDVMYMIDRKNLDKDSSRVVLDVEINSPQFDIALVNDSGKFRPNSLKTFNVTEAFFVYFKVSMLAGFVLGSPWIFYQIWMFVAAGLYPHEKRLVNVYLPFSLGLFLAGVAVCQFLVLPKAVEALLWFNEWMGLEPDLRLTEWLSFAITMPLVFGISFQTPLVMLFIYKIGIIDVATYRNKRRLAWFVLAVFAALITPTVDAISMLYLWVPMGFLYELGILLCVWMPNEEFEDEESAEKEEMVEV